MLFRSGYEQNRPVAFLASFTGREHDVVIPLKAGLTRVGREAPFGDLTFPKDLPPPIEGRQWLVVHRPGHVLVMDDHSTNQSIVLPHSADRLGGGDPRWDHDVYSYAKVRAKAAQGIALDWEGTVVHELREGDVLLAIYSAFVFGSMA